jgi:cytochrome P450
MAAPRSVPEFRYDHRDDSSHRNPWPRWKQMREAGPVVYSSAYGGFYAIGGYRELVDALRDTDVFSSADGTGIPVLPGPRLPPLEVDPPQARRWRELVNPFFSPARVAAYRPWMQELATEIITPLLTGSKLDVARDIGIPLTRRIILTLMGILTEPKDLNRWTDELIFGLNEEAANGGQMISQFLSEHVAARRAGEPGEDLISSLIRVEFRPQNRPLTDDEVVTLLFLLLIAALETTNSAITAMIGYLLEHPDAAARLLAEPQIWGKAMDEFVRWASPAVALARTTRTDTVVGGCPIPKGSKVMMLFGSGNRDEREFAHPDDVRLDRHPNRHLGFGIGPHRCLGSHLAKAQMMCVLQVMLPALAQWRIDNPATVTWHAGATRGQASMPLVRKDPGCPESLPSAAPHTR